VATKPETQIAGGVVVFVAGLFVGRTLQLGKFPAWDYAEWANVAVGGLLVIAAYKGFNEWRRQFFARRDNDLAVRLIAAVEKTYLSVHAFRTPHALLSDRAIAVEDPGFSGEQEHHLRHRVYLARYQAREIHLMAAVEERHAAMTEALYVWDDLGIEVGSLINALNQQEGIFRAEAVKWVDSFDGFDKTTARGEVNREVLFRPVDADREDCAIAVYERAMEHLKTLLRSKIRMDD
jgi:hypothetical protein